MKTLGYILLIAAALMYRAGLRGRALPDIPGDIADGTKALVKGDWQGLNEVYQRAGTLSFSDDAAGDSGGKILGSDRLKGHAVLKKMYSLGEAAKGYRFGASGPDYYDCSGLVYRALKDLGYYSGPRFSTASFRLNAAPLLEQIDTPTVGAIALWRRAFGGHIGVMVDSTNVYSALSVKAGIGVVPVDSLTNIYGKPEYFRIR